MGRIPSSVLVAALVFPAAFLPARTGQATTRTVCASGCEHSRIQAAVDAATDGDTILVNDGTYVENLLLAGRNLQLRSVNGHTATTIDGGAPNAGNPTRGSVVLLTEGSDCLLAGFTLAHGGGTLVDAWGTILPVGSPDGITKGGAVFASDSRAVLEDCVLSGNNAQDGAAVGGLDSQVTLTDCLVTGNQLQANPLYPATVRLMPRELHGTLASLAVRGSQIRDNSAGGIYVEGDVLLHDSLVSRNTNGTRAIASTRVDILRADVRDNDGGGIAVDGGGILVDGGDSTIADSSITGNRNQNSGGGVVIWYSPGATIRNCTIAGNEALGGEGGGLQVGYSGPVHVVNSIITGNRAARGGGGVVVRGFPDRPSLVRISNSTISGNWALRGGGIAVNSSANVELVNTILWGDTASAGQQEVDRNPENAPPETNLFAASYSDIQGGDPQRPGEPWPGEGNVDAAPYFRSPRPAALAPTTEGDYHLASCSGCIDAGTGDVARFPGIPAVDADGEARPRGVGYDIGADEADVPRAAKPYASAADDRATTAEDLPLRIDVLANDTFPAGTTPSVTVFAPRHGTAVANSDGTITYTPGANYNGQDEIHYLASDGLCADPAFVGLEVTRAADPPFEVCPSGCAYSSIQAAIDAAGNGDTVLVHGGRYRERIDFLGKALTVSSANGPERTVIDGGGMENPGVGSVVSFRSDEGPESVLDGLTVTNGSASQGGGITIDGGVLRQPEISVPAPTISNCIIEGNRTVARGAGGGIYIRSGGPTIRNSIIRGNEAAGDGGGIAVYGHGLLSPDITGCLLQGNRAAYGGGLYAFYARDLAITNAVITGNKAVGGGGIYLHGGAGRLVHATVSANCADGASVKHGGALTVENSILWGNCWYRDLDVDDCSFVLPGHLCLPGTADIRFSDLVDHQYTQDLVWPGEGNIGVDPGFVEPLSWGALLGAVDPSVGGDFRLTASSPCIDRTVPQLVSEDIDGVHRPRGAASEMGAYEYGPAPLLRNDSFEEGPVATAWTGRRLSVTDGQVCTTARFGSCSFVIGGRPRADKLLRQQAAIADAGKAGDVFTLSGWSKSRRALRGQIYGLEARIAYADGTTETRRVGFTAGTHGWQKAALTFTAAKSYRGVTVFVRFARQSGWAWFDRIQLSRR